jgi:hypothetical protein
VLRLFGVDRTGFVNKPPMCLGPAQIERGPRDEWPAYDINLQATGGGTRPRDLYTYKLGSSIGSITFINSLTILRLVSRSLQR